MSLSTDIADAVAAARAATLDLLAPVTHHPATGSDGYGVVYGPDVERLALIEDGQSERQGAGTEDLSIAKLTFLESVTVTPNDRFTLPNGTAGGVLRHAALLNGAGAPVMVEVWLG